MDPNEALARLREIFSDENIDNPPGALELEALFRQAGEHFQGLDQWIRRGGSLPLAWLVHP